MTEDKRYRRKKDIISKRGIHMFSVKHISKKYDFHLNTVRAWVTRDGLRCVRHGPGGKIFIREDDVEDFIKKWYKEE